MKRECETCIKRKTPYCPTSIECMATDDMPYYQNRIMILEENEQLKDNWNKLKELIDVKLYNTEYLQKLCGCRIDDVNHLILKIIKNEMQELEQGSDSNGQ